MIASAAAGRKYTPEDLLRMPDGNLYELVDAELVEKDTSLWSSYVAGKIHVRLNDHSLTHRSGWVFPGGLSYQCFPDAPSKVRRPDVSFIRLDRLTFEQAKEEGHCRIAPDLTVEVVSPNDVHYDVDRLVQEQLRAGVKLVWVINPDVRTVAVHRADGSGVILHENDSLSGEDVIPGFTCKISELFVPPV